MRSFIKTKSKKHMREIKMKSFDLTPVSHVKLGSEKLGLSKYKTNHLFNNRPGNELIADIKYRSFLNCIGLKGLKKMESYGAGQVGYNIH